MVIVNRRRCGYCGSCVSLCPVGAINLAETRLQIDEQCIECGLCIDACPVGAITTEADQPGVRALPRSRYDVVVVGARTGRLDGSASRGGARPVGAAAGKAPGDRQPGALRGGCGAGAAGGVHRSRSRVDLRGDQGGYYSAAQGGQTEEMRFDGDELVGYVLERRVFDRVLAERAMAAGATVWVKTPVSGLLCEDGRVVGVLAEV